MYIKVSYQEKECAYCSKLFTPNRKDKIYCKPRCQKSASARRQPDFKSKIREANNRRRFPYRKHKKGYCESCGFLPLHSCQLDVDHIDGNHKNNTPSNLKTLCSNCHRLKTFLNQDYKL